jgi:hypothetical protein
MAVFHIYCTTEHLVGTMLVTEKTPDDGTYVMPKHAADLLMSYAYILVHVMVVT